MAGLFPYDPRPGQQEIVDLVRDSVRAGRAAVMESGTGTGKTSVAMAGALEGIGGSGRKLIFLTRTKSQQRQVALEARAIGRSRPLVCLSLQGRGPATCPTMAEDPDLRPGTSEEMSRLCSALKRGDSAAGGCRYFQAITEKTLESVRAYTLSFAPDPEEFRLFCISIGVCPYEASKRLLPIADVISAPYAFFFVPEIRTRLTEWMGVSERDCVVIVDEAHNLPSYLRDILTCRITLKGLELSRKEAVEAGDPDIGEGLKASDMVSLIEDIFADARREYLKRENDLIPPGYLTEEMMTRLGMSTTRMRACVSKLIDIGIAVAEEKKSHRKLPRSHLEHLGYFITGWWSCDYSSYVFLVSGGDNPSMEAYCLDPETAALPLRACHSSISMSGTLAPLEFYSMELGFNDPELRVFPSPFPRENLRVVYATDVSTKFEEINGDTGVFEKIYSHTVGILGASDRSAAVFFPSYAMMDRFIEKGLVRDISPSRDIFYERRGMPQSELMEQVTDFRSTSGSVLLAVTGGRVSEGLDFPGDELEIAVIVGIPYGRPTAKQDAMVGYCRARFGKGWEYAVKVPAVRRIRQAVGRLIRSERDRGIAVILDRRISSMPSLGAMPTDDPVREVREFFADLCSED